MREYTDDQRALLINVADRIHTSEKHPEILNDGKALSLKDDIPEDILQARGQNEYIYVSSTVRAADMDYYIRTFLREHPDGTVLNLSCGLETSFYRNDNGTATWFELDQPAVIDFRQEMLGTEPRDRPVRGMLFEDAWKEEVRAEAKEPILAVASGVMHFLALEEGMDFLRGLGASFPGIRIVFDAANAQGMRETQQYMKQIGGDGETEYFYVDDEQAFLSSLGNASLLDLQGYYDHTNLGKIRDRKARAFMKMNQKMRVLKVLYLQLGGKEQEVSGGAGEPVPPET